MDDESEPIGAGDERRGEGGTDAVTPADDLAEGPRTAPPYPRRWEADVLLSDGGTVRLRPVRPDDAERVVAFHERQSRESIYFRYFSPHPRLSARELERIVNVDYAQRMAFVALLGGEIIGMASYDVWQRPNEAEVAFIIDDAHQGRGLATLLLEYLIVAAREVGLTMLSATVLPSNRKMLGVFHQAGFTTSSQFEDGLVDVHLGIEPTEEAVAAVEERGRRAEARSVERLLAPSSVAVIGAGRERGTLGHEVFRTLLTGGFQGPVYPVNPHAAHIAGVRCYASVLEIPDDVDLAVLVVPRMQVLPVIDECGYKRVRGLVVVTAGFGDYGVYGPTAHRVLVERARRYGMRIIGPSSLGVVNTSPAVGLRATFADVEVEPGRVGFLTQSGSLGIAALEQARRVGVGISTFVDVGDKSDVSGNDLLQYWEDDERTQVALLYLQSFGNPRKFVRLARRLSRRKPIVAVKTGRGLPRERRNDGMHGGDWPEDATVGALLSQAGVIRVDTPVEMFDVARVLVSQPVPRGHRLAIVSNSGGATAFAADAALNAGLELATLGALTRARLSAATPVGAVVANPVELTYRAEPAHYEQAVQIVLDDPGVDLLLVIYAPDLQDRREEVTRALGASVDGSHDTTVVAAFLGGDGEDVDAVAGTVRIPLFRFPSEAASVLGRLAAYGEWRAEPEGEVPDLELIDEAAVHAVVDEVLAEQPRGAWLDPDRAARVMAGLGIPSVEHRSATTVDEALVAARSLGYPVALKATGLARVRRGEEGGVALDLHGPEALAGAFERMVELFGEAMVPAVVQRMAPAGVEVLVEAHQDPSFGGVVGVGLGGAFTPASPTRPVRVLPVSDVDAHRLVDASPVADLLGSAVDGPARRGLEALLVRLAAVVDRVPEIADIVLNPVLVGDEAVSITAGRVRVAPAVWDGAPPVRRLS